MADTKTEQEPSIEEILESIRQIISDDSETPEAPVAADKPSAPEPAPEPVPAPKSAPAPAPAEKEKAGAILDLTEKVEPEDDSAAGKYSDPPPQIDLQDVPEMPEDDADLSLLSEKTADAAAAEMAKLLSTNVAVEREETGRVGKVTLEDIARDLMRPLIKTWLDENLPRVIEKVVAKEMEKLARRARDD